MPAPPPRYHTHIGQEITVVNPSVLADAGASSCDDHAPLTPSLGCGGEEKKDWSFLVIHFFEASRPANSSRSSLSLCRAARPRRWTPCERGTGDRDPNRTRAATPPLERTRMAAAAAKPRNSQSPRVMGCHGLGIRTAALRARFGSFQSGISTWATSCPAVTWTLEPRTAGASGPVSLAGHAPIDQHTSLCNVRATRTGCQKLALAKCTFLARTLPATQIPVPAA